MKFKVIILIILISSCQTNLKERKNLLQKITPEDSLKLTIIGKWGGLEGEPVWKIEKDSMYYYGEKKSYPYTIKSNDMIVSYKEGPFILKSIHTLKDTLMFTTDYGGVIRAFRFP